MRHFRSKGGSDRPSYRMSVWPDGKYRWSVGKYFGRRRVVVAWFESEADAQQYADLFRTDGFRYDVLKSLF